MIAMTIFLVIAGCAFTLFSQQISTTTSLRGQVGLNLSLRSVVSQLEMDLVNAGENYFQAANMPSWPLGVVIVNNVVNQGSSCYSGGAYGASCYDQINIIPPANPVTYPVTYATNSAGGNSQINNCSDTSTGVAYAQAASGFTLAQTAAEYVAGDQLLFYTNSGSHYTSVVLTAAPAVAGAAVKLTFNATNANGSNTRANDPLDISTCQGTQPCSVGTPNKLSNSFCGQDYIVKLAPVIYKVDSSNSSTPKLTRTQGGTTATVMEQVIGFKVGATVWNSTTQNDETYGTNVPEYFYDSSQYCNVLANCPGAPTAADQAWNFTLVRSIRISLIGRTAPGTMPYSFHNSFDQGSYTVQGMSVVVNPRNMSMND
jgi:hypothetical protein